MSKNTNIYFRGQVWFFNKDITSSTEAEAGMQKGKRPYLVISDNDASNNVDYITVIACSTSAGRINDKKNIKYYSMAKKCDACVLYNQFKTIPKSLFANATYYETLSSATMAQVDMMIQTSLGIKSNNKTIKELESTIEKIIEVKYEQVKKEYENTLSDTISNKIIDIINSKINNDETVIDTVTKVFDDVVEDQKNTVTADQDSDLTPNISNDIKDVLEEIKSKSTELDHFDDDGTDLRRHNKGFWTEERKVKYCEDYRTYSLSAVMKKWGIKSKKSAKSTYDNFIVNS